MNLRKFGPLLCALLVTSGFAKSAGDSDLTAVSCHKQLAAMKWSRRIEDHSGREPEVAEAVVLLAKSEDKMAARVCSEALLINVKEGRDEVLLEGTDEFEYNGSLHLRKTRPDHTSVSVGSSHCVSSREGEWQCRENASRALLLPRVEPNLVFDVSQRRVACDAGHCVILEFKEPAYRDISRNPDFPVLVTDESAEEEWTRYRFELNEATLLPIEYGYTRYRGGRQIEFKVWRPDYAAAVAPIEAPKATQPSIASLPTQWLPAGRPVMQLHVQVTGQAL